MNSAPWITVGIVADVEPTGSWAEVAAEVVSTLLSARLTDAVVVTYTCRTPRSLDIGPAWRSADRLVTDAPPVLIVCGGSAREAAERASSGLLIDAPPLDRDSGLAATLPRLLDPVALDVRRRMLVHLGVIPGGEYTLDDELLARTRATFPLRPIDLHLLAAGAAAIECSDWLPEAVAGHAATDDATALVDAWADAVLDAFPAKVTDRLAGLAAEVERLSVVLDRERVQHAAEIERLGRAPAAPGSDR